jgi:hypothetical protein
MPSYDSDIEKIKVNYDDNDNRTVTCFCGKVVPISLLAHLKKEHPDKWESWKKDFVQLRNKGWSCKRIMWKYRAIFTWAVIEREIRRSAEDGKERVLAQRKPDIKKWVPDFSPEKTTVWDFKDRGDWAVHTSEYRGNWPPQIPRNLILKYTKEDDAILDPFVGGGTTIIEAYLLKRRSVGIDISQNAVNVCNDKIREMEQRARDKTLLLRNYRPIIVRGSALNCLKLLQSKGFGEGSFDLICAHPPYMDSIVYTRNKEDLSRFSNHAEFCKKMGEISRQLYKLLREGGTCGVLIGDVRKEFSLKPLGFNVMEEFMKTGFQIQEIIAKIQHRDRSTEFYHFKDSANYLLNHEYLLVLNK